MKQKGTETIISTSSNERSGREIKNWPNASKVSLDTPLLLLKCSRIRREAVVMFAGNFFSSWRNTPLSCTCEKRKRGSLNFLLDSWKKANNHKSCLFKGGMFGDSFAHVHHFLFRFAILFVSKMNTDSVF